MPKEEKERIGTTESLVRLSVGMEYVENLVTDLSHALAQV
ncbi:MAG TPA: PLP-dependent transferase [Candidatus Dormibacteraeota bacterium]|nr:PLP-dependent transferase [Candidatus Dormibacteraeota bacterium]